MGRLDGKVALVTGASRGLGRAVARAYAREGARLVLTARGGEALNEVAQELKAANAEVVAVQADIALGADVDRMVAVAEERFGAIDILVNNAGILGPSPMPSLIDYPVDDFAEVLRINVLGTFRVTQRVLSGMLQRGRGVILNVTSEAGHVGYEGWGAYGVSKFALEGLSQIWAEELAGTGVRANLVDPGEMDTEMHALAVPDCDYELADPEEVAEAFVYLASAEASHLHGRRVVAADLTAEGR